MGDTSVALTAIGHLLTETFDGARGDQSLYLDSGPDSGFAGLMANLSAAQASAAPNGRRSIVSHAAHTRVHVDAVEARLRGQADRVDWDASWLPATVNDAQWSQFRDDFRKSVMRLRSTVERHANWDERSFAMIMAVIAHAAYHFGAMRQIVRGL